MKFIQTLYIDNFKNPLKYCFGWFAPEFHLMSWALSCLQLYKIYGKVALYANSSAAKLLIDTLELPYSSINLTHDNLKLVNENLWALPKILTYSLQDASFLHLDGDVFLFKKLDEQLLKSELIAQNQEVATDYYLSTQKELLANFTYFPECVRRDFVNTKPIKAVNAGILGGSNIAFIKAYASLAFKYINDNANHLSKINVDRFNVFFEQHLFCSFAKQKNIPISFLFPDTVSDNQYEHLGEFHEVPCLKKYLHLLGHYKKDEYTCIQMAAKLRELYPEYYYKIISLCKKEQLPLFISLYNNKKITDAKDLMNYNIAAKEAYHKGKAGYKTDYDCNEIVEGYENFSVVSILKQSINYYLENPDPSSNKNFLEIDFEKFTKNLFEAIKANTKISASCLYGRDLLSTGWFCELFGNEYEIESKVIVTCSLINIIESEFDWAGLFNKNTRVGVKYYNELELSSGQFFNLVIPEVSVNRVSLFDIDETEKIILETLSEPLSIKTLLLKMQPYVEEEVIKNHLETYNNLLITLIKNLVVKKAIKPFKEYSSN